MGLDVAFDVHDAALDGGLWPGVPDGFERSLLAVGGHNQRGWDLVEQAGVAVGVLPGAPVPGHDVFGGAHHQQARGVEVGAVDEQLVVDAAGIGVTRDLDEPVVVKPVGQCPAADPKLVGEAGA